MPWQRGNGEFVWMKHKIYIVGMGPGKEEMMTEEAKCALEEADVIVGYAFYLELLGEQYSDKTFLSTPMRQEEKRCRLCFQEAIKGKTVAMVCSGDAGVYGMAGLMYEIGKEYQQCELQVVAGITAALSGGAVLGAPLGHDFCVISLSDLLTPWETIEKRLLFAAQGDFAMAIYNPSSHKRRDYLKKACDILLRVLEPQRPCGCVENIGRDNTKTWVGSLEELRNREVNMFTTVFIGNATTEIVGDKLITKRGYGVERKDRKNQ